MIESNEALELLLEGMARENALLRRIAADMRNGPDMATAYKNYAEALHKSVDALSLAEKKQAMLDAVLKYHGN